MFGLFQRSPSASYGLLIDIGSGSVGTAIVFSDPNRNMPQIIWSHRERIGFVDEISHATAAKRITSAVLNAILEVGSTGLQHLTAFDSGGRIGAIQVCISAPWSYTVTKTIAYSDKTDFSINKRLLDELITTAHEMAVNAIDETKLIETIGLEVISRSTVAITANGYRTRNPFGKEARTLAVTHITGMTHKNLIKSVRESQEKVFPKVPVEFYTFMLVYYCVVRDLLPDTAEVCLIDVTAEATEIGIVRDNILKYVTHSPLGYNWIVRECISRAKISQEDAHTLLHSPEAVRAESFSEKQQHAIADVLGEYEHEIGSLFQRTGDNLSIPRTIFLHCDVRTETFFAGRLKAAARIATKSDHTVHLLTSKLLPQDQTPPLTDTAILLSARFFHKSYHCDDYELM